MRGWMAILLVTCFCTALQVTAQDNTPSNSATESSEIERLVLMDLYSATNGDQWRNNNNWGDGDPCITDWFGIFCFQGRVSMM